MSGLRYLWSISLAVVTLSGSVIEASGDPSLSASVSRLEYRQSGHADQSSVVQAEGDIVLENDGVRFEGRIKSKFADKESGWSAFEMHALLGKDISESWYVYGGLRQDLEPLPAWTSAVVGVNGEFLDSVGTDISLFVFETGDVAGRFEVDIDFDITQRLSLQPAFDLDVAISGSEDRVTETGVIVTDMGLRLIYEVNHHVSYYAGVAFERNWAATRRSAEAHRAELENAYFLIGWKLSY